MGRNYGNYFLLLMLFFLLLLHREALADVVSGSVELYDQLGTSKTTDATGLTSEVKSNYILQRYRLLYDNYVFPNFNVQAGGRVDKQDTVSESDTGNAKFTEVLFMPTASLSFRNPFFSTGARYDGQDERDVSGGVITTIIRESRNVFLNFKPEALPTLNMQYIGQRLYDKNHISLDKEDNLILLDSQYLPVRSVQLNYSAAFDDLNDYLAVEKQKSLSQNGRAAYDDHFFDNRISLSTTYTLARQDVQTTFGKAGGFIRVQRFPIAGLASINDTPLLGALNVTPALIDGNLTASSGINIGQQPSLAGDIKQRNVGLDFGIDTAVSTLYVWVDRTLPSAVSQTFSWDIYTSEDNQNWILVQTVFPATFGLVDNRFEISFQTVTARYIKVVTRPLNVAVVPPPGLDVSTISITELQAFLDQQTSQAAGSTANVVTMSETFVMNSKVYLINSERHSLSYDLYYQNTTAGQSGMTTRGSTLTNALIGYEKFNKVFSGSTKIMIENDQYPNGEAITYHDYEAALMASANSFRKMSHNLTVTGKREEWDQLQTIRNSGTLTLSNVAEVYEGIHAYLFGTENIFSQQSGTTERFAQQIGATARRGDNTSMSIGVELIPHRSLTFNVNYDWTEGTQTGSGGPAAAVLASASRRESTLASVSYNPFTTLYLFGSVQTIDETGKPRTKQTSLNGSWTGSQAAGALELRFNYTEIRVLEEYMLTRSYGPYARLKLAIRAYLDASYTITLDESTTGKVESNAFNTNFKYYF